MLRGLLIVLLSFISFEIQAAKNWTPKLQEKIEALENSEEKYEGPPVSVLIIGGLFSSYFPKFIEYRQIKSAFKDAGVPVLHSSVNTQKSHKDPTILPTLLDEMRMLLQLYPNRKVVIFGHSKGGIIAWEFLKALPKLDKKLSRKLAGILPMQAPFNGCWLAKTILEFPGMHKVGSGLLWAMGGDLHGITDLAFPKYENAYATRKLAKYIRFNKIKIISLVTQLEESYTHDSTVTRTEQILNLPFASYLDIPDVCHLMPACKPIGVSGHFQDWKMLFKGIMEFFR